MKDIKNYSICLYSEKFGVLKPYGSGILVNYHEGYYLITAYHVMDREEDQLEIENDPDEYDIPQDDFDNFYIKINDDYILINDLSTGIVFTCRYDIDTNQPIINEDTEFCICPLYMSIVQVLLDNGYKFYPAHTSFFPEISSDNKVILSGFPKYAQKQHIEEFRTYDSSFKNYDIHDNGLFQVRFDNSKAYNFEHQCEIQLPSQGIEGMSGGGIWCEIADKLIPMGIIIRQDVDYVTGYRMNWILDFIDKEFKTNSN